MYVLSFEINLTKELNFSEKCYFLLKTFKIIFILCKLEPFLLVLFQLVFVKEHLNGKVFLFSFIFKFCIFFGIYNLSLRGKTVYGLVQNLEFDPMNFVPTVTGNNYLRTPADF